MDILDQYFKTAPTYQQMVDLFKGEWSSKLPHVGHADLISGNAELFNDNRIKLLNEYFPLENKNILELGPLEAGHTYMMHQLGAASILAVESNARSYLKCLIVKELYKLNKAHFILGDALEYMKEGPQHFDLCVASGILYHSVTPHLFIEACTKTSSHVFMWTHYYDPETMSAYPTLEGKFVPGPQIPYKELELNTWKFNYLASLDWPGFCGGPEPHSLWISKEDIFEIFNMNGFANIHTFFEDPTHPLGPNICFMAGK